VKGVARILCHSHRKYVNRNQKKDGKKKTKDKKKINSKLLESDFLLNQKD
jgi:hypothetical protein